MEDKGILLHRVQLRKKTKIIHLDSGFFLHDARHAEEIAFFCTHCLSTLYMWTILAIEKHCFAVEMVKINHGDFCCVDEESG